MTHELKILPDYFGDVNDETKTFELRKNDRGFFVGDVLILCEWDDAEGVHTGRYCARKVVYIIRSTAFGLEKDHVIMGLIPHVGKIRRPILKLS